jgi:hypothetical protein
MKTKVLILAAVLGAGIGPALAAAPETPKGESRVKVVLVNPDKFTDVRYEDHEENSPALLDQFQTFLRETGEYYVPAGFNLEIKVTNISLAGKFEPWRGPEFDHVRIVRDLYPPRITLEFRLTDAQGAVVSEGQREITDLAFQMRNPFPQDDYLRYEKDMLKDWFRREFRSLRKK